MISLCLKALVAGHALLTRTVGRNEWSEFRQRSSERLPHEFHCNAGTRIRRGGFRPTPYCAVETELAAIVTKLTKLTNMRKTPGMSLFFSLRE
jgi:hypothetical protein